MDIYELRAIELENEQGSRYLKSSKKEIFWNDNENVIIFVVEALNRTSKTHHAANY